MNCKENIPCINGFSHNLQCKQKKAVKTRNLCVKDNPIFNLLPKLIF